AGRRRDAQGCPYGQGLRGLAPERPEPPDGGPVLAAGRSAADGRHTAPLGRGRTGRRRGPARAARLLRRRPPRPDRAGRGPDGAASLIEAAATATPGAGL